MLIFAVIGIVAYIFSARSNLKDKKNQNNIYYITNVLLLFGMYMIFMVQKTLGVNENKPVIEIFANSSIITLSISNLLQLIPSNFIKSKFTPKFSYRQILIYYTIIIDIIFVLFYSLKIDINLIANFLGLIPFVFLSYEIYNLINIVKNTKSAIKKEKVKEKIEKAKKRFGKNIKGINDLKEEITSKISFLNKDEILYSRFQSYLNTIDEIIKYGKDTPKEKINEVVKNLKEMLEGLEQREENIKEKDINKNANLLEMQQDELMNIMNKIKEKV